MSVTDEWAAAQRALKKLPVEIASKVVIQAERKAARVVVREARRLVPVRTGLLKRSIGVAKAKPIDTPRDSTRFYILPKAAVKMTRKVLVDGQSGRMKITTRAFHGHLVEFGTRKMAARPYLAPAADHTRDEVVRVFQSEIHKGVDKQLEKMRW